MALTDKLTNGLWYSPYVKIYSAGGRIRVAEISTYPRAYKDTVRHVYLEDQPIFKVTENDCNGADDDGKPIFQDVRGKNFYIGQRARILKGTPLPGAWPKWIASETLLGTLSKDEPVFDLSIIPHKMEITEAETLQDKDINRTIAVIKFEVLD